MDTRQLQFKPLKQCHGRVRDWNHTFGRPQECAKCEIPHPRTSLWQSSPRMNKQKRRNSKDPLCSAQAGYEQRRISPAIEYQVFCATSSPRLDQCGRDGCTGPRIFVPLPSPYLGTEPHHRIAAVPVKLFVTLITLGNVVEKCNVLSEFRQVLGHLVRVFPYATDSGPELVGKEYPVSHAALPPCPRTTPPATGLPRPSPPAPPPRQCQASRTRAPARSSFSARPSERSSTPSK